MDKNPHVILSALRYLNNDYISNFPSDFFQSSWNDFKRNHNIYIVIFLTTWEQPHGDEKHTIIMCAEQCNIW